VPAVPHPDRDRPGDAADQLLLSAVSELTNGAPDA
jgi:hypothetical protein